MNMYLLPLQFSRQVMYDCTCYFMLRIFTNILLMFLMLLLLCGSASASDRRSPFGLGVGAGAGIGKHLNLDGSSDVSFINVAVVRARFFWIVGIDYEFDLGRSRELMGFYEFRELNYHAKMRLSAILYSFSFSNSAFYFKGGFGAAKLNELFNLDAPGASYHGGFGVEFDIDDHMTLDLSFVVVLPGVRSLIDRSLIDFEVPSLIDLISIRNHELVARLLIFL